MYHITLKTAFKAMLYAAKNEGLENELDKKYLELENRIDSYEELDIIDMIHNIENIYEEIDQSVYDEIEAE